jgi:hypothetical protein
MDENEIRIGDAEREDAVKRLGEHYEAGRLTADEHSERVDRALQAKTGTELTALFADLPGPHQARGPRSGDQPGAQSTAQPGQSGSGQSGAGWQPPWAQAGSGWGQAPWAQAGSGSGQAPWSGGRSGRGGWVPRVGGIPVPLLVLLGVLVMAGFACAVAGGHPPFFLLIPAAIATYVVLRRRPRGSTT